ncbi:unnamed protein product [Clavelina lepadiformis]|uniref:Uncharacterized protein n=1 Tax=Clavelina lepadiformis TaxID=159417 RepID=A0ABP0H057_CLALP
MKNTLMSQNQAYIHNQDLFDNECDVEQDVVQEESSSENAVPTLPNREKIVSRDGTIWAPEFPPQNGRASKRNIIKTRSDTKQFVLARVDNAKNVFQEFDGQLPKVFPHSRVTVDEQLLPSRSR